jgi:hypothetical protein
MRRGLALVALAGAALLGAQGMRPGKNVYDLRGRQQDVYYYPSARQGQQSLGPVLFAPGDGGWRGFAITMAGKMAGWGYDVYGLDTKRYLESFTDGRKTLSEADVASDFRSLGKWVSPSGGVRLVGWSEGAGLGLLGVADDPDRKTFNGFVAIGMGEASFLGWRTIDNLTYITKKDPDEPRFASLPWMLKIAPTPFAMIHSDHDDYTTVEAAKKLFAAARQPKRWWLIPARNHRFSGGQEGFFSALRAALEWTGRGGR